MGGHDGQSILRLSRRAEGLEAYAPPLGSGRRSRWWDCQLRKLQLTTRSVDKLSYRDFVDLFTVDCVQPQDAALDDGNPRFLALEPRGISALQSARPLNPGFLEASHTVIELNWLSRARLCFDLESPLADFNTSGRATRQQQVRVGTRLFLPPEP
mgnify:CR=1 FL=1